MSCRRPEAGASPRALRRLVRESRVDLVIPTIDRHVQALSDARAPVPRQGLPAGRTRHQRSAATSTGSPRRCAVTACVAPATYPVRRAAAGVDEIFCSTRAVRAGSGAGRGRERARAAGPPSRRRDAGAAQWMAVWQTMQGVPISDFTLARVPARAGDPLSERVAARPNGPRQHLRAARLLRRRQHPERRHVAVVAGQDRGRATASWRSAGRPSRPSPRAPRAPSGVDVKEDADGRPHVTEINAGRFFMAMTAFRSRPQAPHRAHVRAPGAEGARVDFGETYDAVDDYYMVRDMDIEPGVFHADDFFDGVHDASSAAQFTVRPARTGKELRPWVWIRLTRTRTYEVTIQARRRR